MVFKLCFLLAVEAPSRFVELVSVASYKYIGYAPLTSMCLMVLLKILGLGPLQTLGQLYFYASTCFLVFRSVKRLGAGGAGLSAGRGRLG